MHRPSFESNSQEDVGRGDVEYDIGTWDDAGRNGSEIGRVALSLLFLTINSASKESVVHCRFVLIVIQVGHDSEMDLQWRM